MEGRRNLEPRKYKADPDQTRSNGQNYDLVKVNSTSIGEQAAPLIEETGTDTGLELLAKKEGGEEGVVPTEGVVKMKQPPSTHQQI
ncbi:hypothetical protein NDU88_006344 [Pleurodeles waltl]|uniref:Uncharacterized protein n=1 Tax=Pleurodeles waltl TaxID=8319 RepID=A0AAV7NT03_PLEWA|nr:hypothetical protein NDU88_006344 [Pleurodeles waltl]